MTVEAFTALARRQPAAALGHARAVLGHTGALGIGHGFLRWVWPLATRAASDLQDATAVSDLLALLDGWRPGHLTLMLLAERELVRARQSAADSDPDATAAFTAAITGLRQHSTPYHLAHGLLDHADYLTRRGDSQAAEQAIAEARDIVGRLRCQPLLDRAAPDARTTTRPGLNL